MFPDNSVFTVTPNGPTKSPKLQFWFSACFLPWYLVLYQVLPLGLPKIVLAFLSSCSHCLSPYCLDYCDSLLLHFSTSSLAITVNFPKQFLGHAASVVTACPSVSLLASFAMIVFTVMSYVAISVSTAGLYALQREGQSSCILQDPTRAFVPVT